jgi:ATP-dependent RNA helicase SUPV3L1/SUV3
VRLSPRTRNAPGGAFISRATSIFWWPTDAIGMGLNLDVDHVAFAGVRKFDGQVHRELTAESSARSPGAQAGT